MKNLINQKVTELAELLKSEAVGQYLVIASVQNSEDTARTIINGSAGPVLGVELIGTIIAETMDVPEEAAENIAASIIPVAFLASKEGAK